MSSFIVVSSGRCRRPCERCSLRHLLRALAYLVLVPMLPGVSQYPRVVSSPSPCVLSLPARITFSFSVCACARVSACIACVCACPRACVGVRVCTGAGFRFFPTSVVPWCSAEEIEMAAPEVGPESGLLFRQAFRSNHSRWTHVLS